MTGISIQCTVIPVSSHVHLLHYSNDPKGNPWSSPSSVYPKGPSQSHCLSPFPSSYHWGKRRRCGWHWAEPTRTGCWVLCAELPGRKPNITKEIGTVCPVAVWKLWSSRMKNYYKYSYLVTFNNLLFLFSCPCHRFQFILFVSLTALCTWSIPLARSWWRFSLGFTRGKKQWHQKEKGRERRRGNKALTYSKSHLNIKTGAEKLLLLFKYIFCFHAILSTGYFF